LKICYENIPVGLIALQRPPWGHKFKTPWVVSDRGVFYKSSKTTAFVEREKRKDPKKTTAKKLWASSYERVIPFKIKGYCKGRKGSRCVIDSVIETVIISSDRNE
jgi:hypothetical protein